MAKADANSEGRTVCRRCGREPLRVEPGGLGRKTTTIGGDEGTSPARSKVLAAFLFSSGSCVSNKKDDKTAAPGDSQARLTRQRRDFFILAQRNDCQDKKRPGAAMRKRKERKRHDKLARYEQPEGREALFYTLKN